MVTKSLNRPGQGLPAGTAAVSALFRLKTAGVQGAFGFGCLATESGKSSRLGRPRDRRAAIAGRRGSRILSGVARILSGIRGLHGRRMRPWV